MVPNVKPKRILYLQLPLLDNDARAGRENFPFAGAYLDHALRNSPEAPYFSSMFAPTAWDELDTRHLANRIISAGTDILACTLYLWNIERTLRLAEILKQAKPELKIIAGGPEAAPNHPLLFARPLLDTVVTGEGEGVFPAILSAWRTGAPINCTNVAISGPNGWSWGTHPPPAIDLAAAQPGEETMMACVQNRPVVYLETVRGCPLTCAYCRYYQLHTGLRALSTEQVVIRIARFRELGATEIRFVDPTFNARQNFTGLLTALAELNHDRRLSFFAEIRADTLTAKQARLMGEANFTEVEIGVQSIDPQVLQNVQRPGSVEKYAPAIRALTRAGVRATLDVMYGLPGQPLADVKQSIDWCLAFGDGAQVQCMQTLVLPGTLLREKAGEWNIHSDSLPPYGVTQTADLSPDDIRNVETLLDEHPQLPADPVTPRFCCQRLAGLFREQHRIGTDQLDQPVPGRSNRRTLIVHGADLFGHRHAIGALIERAIESEPHGLWQFVLEPEMEEPLDLIDELAACIRRQRPHLLDRFASASAFGLTVSRRLYVRVKNNVVSNAWKNATESLLRESFG